MSKARKVLSMGASYGSLLAIKLVAAGHDVKLACTPAGAAAFNANGARVRMPLRGGAESFEIDSRTLPGRLSAAKPDDVRPEGYDLVVLAMQEPQYLLPGVRELLQAVAVSRVPCMSIMNMPPPPFLRRIPGVPVDALRACYADFDAWQAFEPGKMTLCSPDPQAFRPPGEPPNVLQVRLATNFKAARFASDADTSLLRELEAGIEAARFDAPEGRIELPVKLKIHESLFVPIAKWSMLLAGNYRCIGADGMRPIRDAVHGDLDASRSVYEWVSRLSMDCGAAADDLVPFDKYANAARSLGSPSSVARALAGGSTAIERVDRIVQAIGVARGQRSEAVDAIVANVDRWIEENLRRAAVETT